MSHFIKHHPSVYIPRPVNYSKWILGLCIYIIYGLARPDMLYYCWLLWSTHQLTEFLLPLGHRPLSDFLSNGLNFWRSSGQFYIEMQNFIFSLYILMSRLKANPYFDLSPPPSKKNVNKKISVCALTWKNMVIITMWFNSKMMNETRKSTWVKCRIHQWDTVLQFILDSGLFSTRRVHPYMYKHSPRSKNSPVILTNAGMPWTPDTNINLWSISCTPTW